MIVRSFGLEVGVLRYILKVAFFVGTILNEQSQRKVPFPDKTVDWVTAIIIHSTML